MKLRDATPRDDAAILRLNAQSVSFLSPLDAPALRHLAQRSAYLRVVETDGEVAAFLLAFGPGADYASENYRWFASRYTQFLYIDRVVVAQSHQGQGLGRAMYEDLFAFAREHAYVRVVCEFDTEPPNPVSAAFHARFGFREVGSQWVRGGLKRVSLQEAAVARHNPGMETASDQSVGDKPALPDRLSVDPRSPHHVAAIFEHDVGIRFNGRERHDVEEYCVSEGWIRVPAGKTLDRKGQPLIIKLKGKVEPFYK
jgi:predicted GNAT superfamily acetyltransferase